MGWQLHGTKNCAMPLHMAVDQPCLLLVQLMEFLRSKHPTMAQVLEVVLGDIGTTAHTCLLSNRLCGCVCVCVCVCAVQYCIGCRYFQNAFPVPGSWILQNTVILQCCQHVETGLLMCSHLHQTPVRHIHLGLLEIKMKSYVAACLLTILAVLTLQGPGLCRSLRNDC